MNVCVSVRLRLKHTYWIFTKLTQTWKRNFMTYVSKASVTTYEYQKWITTEPTDIRLRDH